jgi:hypothetical protein
MNETNPAIDDLANRMENLGVNSVPRNYPIHATAAPLSVDLKMDHVARFNGTPTLLNRFLMQLDLYFACGPSVFADDRARVNYAISRLEGTAAAWIEPLYLSQDVATFGSYDNFVNSLRIQFGDTHCAVRAAKKLFSLRQGSKPIHEFINEFRLLLHQAGWSTKDKAAYEIFWTGISPSLNSHLLNYEDPMDLEKLMILASRVEQRVINRTRPEAPRVNQQHDFGPRAARRGFVPQGNTHFRGAPQRPNPQNTPRPDEPVPMEIDGLRNGTSNSGRLTPAERQYRMSNGLCLYCGEKGHLLRDCPKRPTINGIDTGIPPGPAGNVLGH